MKEFVIAEKEAIVAIANAARYKGRTDKEMSIGQIAANVQNITPVLEGLTATENGTYVPGNGVDGFNQVKVEVPIPEVKLQDKTVTENGTYTADTGFDGLGSVTVDVASSGGGTIEGDFVKYLAYNLDDVNKEITVYGILWSKLYEDTGSYDVNIPSHFGDYQVVISSRGAV